MTRRDGRDDGSPRGRAAVEGILGGLADMLTKAIELAERAELLGDGDRGHCGDGSSPRFHVGFNVRTMAGASGEPSVRVEPFGDVRHDPASGEARVSERREPPADVFQEQDHVLVVVEMPGVRLDDAEFVVEGDVLSIIAERGSKRYAKEVLLPSSFEADAMSVSDLNGVFEVRLTHQKNDDRAQGVSSDGA